MLVDFIDEDITTDAEVDAALGQFLLKAMRNDIDPRGIWVYRNGQTIRDWEIMTSELASKNDTE